MQTLKSIWEYILNAINIALAWVILSSKNPSAVSLTVKAALVLGLTWLTTIAGLGHIQLPTQELTQLIDTIVQAIQTGLTFVSLIVAAYGIVRKIANTLQGQHAGLNSVLGN